MTTGIPIRQMAFTANFRCLGAECEDTCCKSWSMQVDPATHTRYREQAPELLDAVTEGAVGLVMKRDSCSDYCVKFEQGLCAIHRDYGSAFLGDACHFYPRVTRRLGRHVVMTAVPSCPEVARLALLEEGGFSLVDAQIDRMPHEVKDYLPDALDADAALSVHMAFLAAAGDEQAAPERIMARVVSVAQSLASIGEENWLVAAPFYLRSADARLMPAERAKADPFNLLHALMGIAAAAGAQERERLRSTIHDMEKALHVTLGWQEMGIAATGDSAAAFAEMEQAWHAHYAPKLNPMLRRWIASQLSLALFPFAGFGANPGERAYLMGVRFATVRLALMAASHVRGDAVGPAEQVRIIQSLARVLDHLAAPEMSLQIYEEPGWLREPRLRALMGDK